MKGVLLAGGTGSRLRPITHTGPKQLIPVGNKPVLQYAIEDLREAGVTEIGVVLGNKGGDKIQEFLGNGSRFGVDITYIFQGEPLGLAHAVGCARDFVGDDDFIMYLGDNILDQGVSSIIEGFEEGDFAAGIALQHVENPSRFGIAETNEGGKVLRLVEKPDDPPSNLALIGIYVFSKEVFDVVERIKPSWRGELEITDAIQALLEEGYEVDSQVIDGWWKDTGKPEDILEANRLVLEGQTAKLDGDVAEGALVEGRVYLHESAEILKGAVVRGPVSIDAGTIIGDNAYIGPFTSIGPGSTIKDANIENSVLVGDTDIATSGKIVDSLIGSGTSIGSADDELPEGRRVIVGENSSLKL